MSKLTTLQEAMGRVNDGDTVALGGNVLHRAPMAAAAELARQGRRGLHLVKTAGAMDVDLLCAAGAVASVTFGYIAYEPPYGLCQFFRRAVQEGRVEARENACYTVIMGLRAAVYGLPFLPVRGLDGSDLIAARGFKKVANPYGEGEFVAIPAIRPDVAILHVQEADELGNGRIGGPKYEDALMAKAARRVILTAERIVETARFEAEPDRTDIPGFLVEAVVHAPGGAAPGSCAGHYGIDDAQVRAFQAVTGPEELGRYLEQMAARTAHEGVSR